MDGEAGVNIRGARQHETVEKDGANCIKRAAHIESFLHLSCQKKKLQNTEIS